MGDNVDMDERELPMSRVLSRLPPVHSQALERLMQIFPTISCHVRREGDRRWYVFRASYEGLQGETGALAHLSGAVVEALIQVTARLMEQHHHPQENRGVN